MNTRRYQKRNEPADKPEYCLAKNNAVKFFFTAHQNTKRSRNKGENADNGNNKNDTEKISIKWLQLLEMHRLTNQCNNYANNGTNN